MLAKHAPSSSVGIVMLHNAQIGVHAAQKSSLLIFAGLFFVGLGIVMRNGVIKIAFSAFTNIDTIWLDDHP